MSIIPAYKPGWHGHSVDGYVWQHGTMATFYTSPSARSACITALNHHLVKAGTLQRFCSYKSEHFFTFLKPETFDESLLFRWDDYSKTE